MQRNNQELLRILKLRYKTRALIAKEDVATAEQFHKTSDENILSIFRRTKISFLTEGALSQKRALALVCLQDDDTILATISEILKNLQTRIATRQSLHNGTKEFIDKLAIKIKMVTEMQNWAPMILFMHIESINKFRIMEDIRLLNSALTHATVIREEATLWFELVLWLEGLFLRNHKKALEHGGGQLTFTNDPDIVAPIDDEDDRFFAGRARTPWTGTGVTKHFIHSSFHALAVLLEEKIKRNLDLTFKINDVFPSCFVKAAHAEHERIERPYARAVCRATFGLFFKNHPIPMDVIEHEISKYVDLRTAGHMSRANKAAAENVAAEFTAPRL